jgi:hypothetical protein
MTNQQTAIATLLVNINAGQWNTLTAVEALPVDGFIGNDWVSYWALAYRAVLQGSLDAALSLHEAIVPEWHVTHAWGNSKDGWSWCLSRPANADRKARYVEGKSTYAAIALLIAILAAYAVQLEDPKDINIEHTEEVAK